MFTGIGHNMYRYSVRYPLLSLLGVLLANICGLRPINQGNAIGIRRTICTTVFTHLLCGCCSLAAKDTDPIVSSRRRVYVMFEITVAVLDGSRDHPDLAAHSARFSSDIVCRLLAGTAVVSARRMCSRVVVCCLLCLLASPPRSPHTEAYTAGCESSLFCCCSCLCLKMR